MLKNIIERNSKEVFRYMYEPVLQSTFALLTRAHTAHQATSILNHAIANKQQPTNVLQIKTQKMNKCYGPKTKYLKKY